MSRSQQYIGTGIQIEVAVVRIIANRRVEQSSYRCRIGLWRRCTKKLLGEDSERERGWWDRSGQSTLERKASFFWRLSAHNSLSLPLPSVASPRALFR